MGEGYPSVVEKHPLVGARMPLPVSKGVLDLPLAVYTVLDTVSAVVAVAVVHPPASPVARCLEDSDSQQYACAEVGCHLILWGTLVLRNYAQQAWRRDQAQVHQAQQKALLPVLLWPSAAHPRSSDNGLRA